MLWLVLNSKDYRDRIEAILRTAGHSLLDRGWHWSDCKLGERPEVVSIDYNAPKEKFLEAGYWRGRGLPVVYLKHPSNRRTHTDRLVGTLAGIMARSLIDFQRVIDQNWPRVQPIPAGVKLADVVVMELTRVRAELARLGPHPPGRTNPHHDYKECRICTLEKYERELITTFNLPMWAGSIPGESP